MANYYPGSEPKELRIKLDRLFVKLDEYYPDKIVIGLHNDHKKLGERITAMYRALGYPDYQSFLVAYGYHVERKASGRKKTVDPKNVIAELQRRYPDGSPFWKLNDLFAENPDLFKSRKALTNNAPSAFGMPLAAYLRSIGLLAKNDENKDAKAQSDTGATKEDVHYPAQRIEPDICVKDVSNIRKDEYALYHQLPNGKWRLEHFKQTNSLCYTMPDDVEEVCDDAFIGCKELHELRLGNSCTVFKETWFREPPVEVYLSKSVRSLVILQATNMKQYTQRLHVFHPRAQSEGSKFSEERSKAKLPHYVVAEENEHLFLDEDTLYEVLTDGSFRLLSCRYTGMGRITVLDGTSEIGPDAFAYCAGPISICLPETIRVIGDRAFWGAGIRYLKGPALVKQTYSYAFARCHPLKAICRPDKSKWLDPDNCACNNMQLYTRGEYTGQNDFPFCSDDLGEALQGLNLRILAGKLSCLKDASIRYEEDSDSILIESKLRQRRTDYTEYVDTWIHASLNCHVGESVDWLLGAEDWIGCVTKKGEVIGTLDDVSSLLSKYRSSLIFSGGKITSLQTPKERGHNAKYPKICVTMRIGLRRLELDTKNCVQQEYSYAKQNDGIILFRWIGDGMPERVALPSYIDGFPVTRLGRKFLQPLYGAYGSENHTNELRELILPQKLKYLDAMSLYFESMGNRRDSTKRIIFPASLENIDSQFCSERRSYSGGYEEGDWFSSYTICVVPRNSFSEQFMLSYQSHFPEHRFLVVYDDAPEAEQLVINLAKKELCEDGYSLHISDWPGDYPNDSAITSLSFPEIYQGKPVVELKLAKPFTSWVKAITIHSGIRRIILEHGENRITLSRIRGSGRFSTRELELGLCANSIEQVIVDVNNPYLHSDHAAIFTKDKKILLQFLCGALETYSIPDGTEEITSSAFAGMRRLKTVAFPSSLRKIGSLAFSGCIELSSFVGIDGVPEIAPDAFQDVLGEERGDFRTIGHRIITRYIGAAQKLIAIPEGFQKIENTFLRFADNVTKETIEEIYLPNSITNIEYWPFSEACHLKKLHLPERLVALPKEFFFYFNDLSRLEIPASVQSIRLETCMYNTASKRQEIWVDPNNMSYCSWHGMLFTKDKKVLLSVPPNHPASRLELPEETIEIANYASQNCRNLMHIDIPRRILRIGNAAFYGASNAIVKLPSSIQNVGKDAFYNCKEIEVSDNTKLPGTIIGEIGGNTFSVFSSQTGQIKYRIWMKWEGAESDQYNKYYRFAQKSWGDNATFPVEELDKWFLKIKAQETKLHIAKYRLEYPINLNTDMRQKYEAYLLKQALKNEALKATQARFDANVFIKIADLNVGKGIKKALLSRENIRSIPEKMRRQLLNSQSTEEIIELRCTQDKLFTLINTLSKLVGECGIVLSNFCTDSDDDWCTNSDEDWQEGSYFYLGEEVRSLNQAIHFNLDRVDVPAWLNSVGTSYSKAEQKQLFHLGIAGKIEHGRRVYYKYEIPSIPYSVFLRETGIPDRIQRIEHIHSGDPLLLRRAGKIGQPQRIEVVHALGTIGTLPSNIGDALFPFVEYDLPAIDATVLSVVPHSQRNCHSNSALIAVHIQINSLST
ncbi:MAG: leucine-rich repeat protein [Oscillospiraceae bacterium]